MKFADVAGTHQDRGLTGAIERPDAGLVATKDGLLSNPIKIDYKIYINPKRLLVEEKALHCALRLACDDRLICFGDKNDPMNFSSFGISLCR